MKKSEDTMAIEKSLRLQARKFVRDFYNQIRSSNDGDKVSDSVILWYFEVLSREFNDFVPNNYKPRKDEVA